jgi:hypothetical protein
MDLKGDPSTNSATLTERFRRPNYGTLEIEFTVDDPKAYTKPWAVTFKQAIVPETELPDEICLEGSFPRKWLRQLNTTDTYDAGWSRGAGRNVHQTEGGYGGRGFWAEKPNLALCLPDP